MFFAKVLVLLIDTVGAFFVYLLLARFHFQWLRVPFRNQVGAFVIALTNWIVVPARRVIPTLRGLDLATLLAAWLLQAVSLYVLQVVVQGWDAAAAALPLIAGVAALDLLRYSILILMFALLVLVVLSWINAESPLGPVVNAFTGPFLRPIKRFVPPVSNFDLSPAVLMLVLIVVLMAITDLGPTLPR